MEGLDIWRTHDRIIVGNNKRHVIICPIPQPLGESSVSVQGWKMSASATDVALSFQSHKWAFQLKDLDLPYPLSKVVEIKDPLSNAQRQTVIDSLSHKERVKQAFQLPYDQRTTEKERSDDQWIPIWLLILTFTIAFIFGVFLITIMFESRMVSMITYHPFYKNIYNALIQFDKEGRFRPII